MRNLGVVVGVAGVIMLGAPVGAGAVEKTVPTVAVLYFDYDGKKDDLAVLKKGLAQMLISDLGALEQCQLVERSRLEAVLEEHKLAQSGKIDRATAARVGKLLGARAMILGGFFDLGKSLRVDARLVDVETGRVLGAAGITGKDDDFLDLEQRLVAALEGVIKKELPPLAAGAKPDLSKPKPDPTRPGGTRQPRPPPPARLKTETALAYSQALAAADKGDRAAARARLEKVLDTQPDFRLARSDLERLMQ